PTRRRCVLDEVIDLSTVIRTCIGCRQRVDAKTLVRTVAGDRGRHWRVVVDHDGTLPGRGAHIHPDPECLQLAVRRRAFGRALRVQGPVSAPTLAELRAGTIQTDLTNRPAGPRTEAGAHAHEHSMSTFQ